MTSYNIRPQANKKFQVAKVQNLIKTIVDSECSKVEYNEETATAFSEKLSIKIIEKLRELDFESYKYIVNVICGERRGSGIQGTSKCYYDSDSDAVATYTYLQTSNSHHQKSVFCIATVFGIYYY